MPISSSFFQILGFLPAVGPRASCGSAKIGSDGFDFVTTMFDLFASGTLLSSVLNLALTAVVFSGNVTGGG